MMQETIPNVNDLTIISYKGLRCVRCLTLDDLSNHPHILAMFLFVLVDEIIHLAWLNHTKDAPTCLCTVALSQSKLRLKGRRRLT